MALHQWGSESQKFGFINKVEKVNWPPLIALRQSELRKKKIMLYMENGGATL